MGVGNRQARVALSMPLQLWASRIVSCLIPTLGCRACSPLPQVLGRSEARAGSGPTASRTLHRLELRAPALPPWVLDRLAAVLAVTQVRAAWLGVAEAALAPAVCCAAMWSM